MDTDEVPDLIAPRQEQSDVAVSLELTWTRFFRLQDASIVGDDVETIPGLLTGPEVP